MRGRRSWLIDQAFPAADTSDFAGSVRCDAVGKGLFSAVALEMDPGNRGGSATKPKPPDSLRREASQAAGAAPTLRYGPAGDSAPRLRLRRLVWPKGSLSASPKHE